ncbi:MAG: hypothetical protein JNK57_15270 [Planctomycetaceae bacterium]|nr:hypothetical protein [Planctomycetaceae bacterium]
MLIILKTQHNPIVGGYGLGIRSRLFGYLIRVILQRPSRLDAVLLNANDHT